MVYNNDTIKNVFRYAVAGEGPTVPHWILKQHTHLLTRLVEESIWIKAYKLRVKTSYWSPANVSEPRRWKAGVFLSGINMSISTFSAPLPGDMSKQLHKNVMNVQPENDRRLKWILSPQTKLSSEFQPQITKTKPKNTPKNLNSIQEQWKYNEPAIYLSMGFIATFLHVKNPFVSNWLTQSRDIHIIRNIKMGDFLVTRLTTSTF